MAVVPAGTSLTPTQIRHGRPCPPSRPLHRRLAGGDRLHRTPSSIGRELIGGSWRRRWLYRVGRRRKLGFRL
ncbi:transcriptional regulator [Sesbania bispinosa]|nr:transcriptional regulator [Sesbania bispinosa]